VPRVDIEEFYDADERRRQSAEVEFGRDWTDDHNIRHELSWVEDTGELYVLREPVPHGYADPFGGIHYSGTHQADETEVEGMTVIIVSHVDTRDKIEAALDGWQDAIAAPDSVSWLVDRLRQAGLLDPANPSTSYPS